MKHDSSCRCEDCEGRRMTPERYLWPGTTPEGKADLYPHKRLEPAADNAEKEEEDRRFGQPHYGHDSDNATEGDHE